MGYIVQSIVFDKDKGWDIKSAREWVKNHKEFSKPIKEEETINTIRVRLFPPKTAEQMGFKDYRMKTLASGDVGIMLDIAYNKMKGSGTSSSKAKVAVIDAETERQIARDEEVNNAFVEFDRLSNTIKPIEEKLYRIKGNLRGRADTDTQAKINELEAELNSLYEQRNIHGKILEDYQTTGGSLANEDLQALLAKSYHSKNPEDYKDFKVDKDLSGQRVQVYHNPTTQQTIVAHRGTSSVPNWIENVAYAVGNDKSGKAFQHSKKIQDQAYQKYGKENITTIGHSKGALHAQEYGKEGKEVITLNKPVNITDALFTRVPKSQTDIRTQYDPVSFLRPFQRGNKAETIKSTTKNPLAEHKTSVLGRLDPRRLFGSAVPPPPSREEGEDKNPATTTIQEIQEAQEQQQLEEKLQAVNLIIVQEYNSIIQLFRSESDDPRSLQTGLVPEFLLKDQIRIAYNTNIAGQLRQSILEQVTANTDISNPQQIRTRFRQRFADMLKRRLIDSGVDRRYRVGSGMSGGMAMCSRCGVNCSCGMVRGGAKLYEPAERPTQPLIPRGTLTSFTIPYVNSRYNGFVIGLRDRNNFYNSILNFVLDNNRGLKVDFTNMMNTARGRNRVERTMGSSVNEVDLPFIISTITRGDIEGIDDIITTWSSDIQNDLDYLINEESDDEEEEGAGMYGGAGVAPFNEEEFGEYENVFNTTRSLMSIVTKLTKFIERHGGNRYVVRQRLLSSYSFFVPNSNRQERDAWISKFDRYVKLGEEDEEEEGSGMYGGKFGDTTDPLTYALYLLGGMIGVPLTSATFNYLRNLYLSNRQVIDDDMTDTTGSVSDTDSVMGEEGAGMSGGSNILDITTNRITYNIDLSSKQGFYNTALPYYNAVNLRSVRINGSPYAIRDVVNELNQNPEWNRYYQATFIPKIIRSMETTNSNDTETKLRIFKKNMKKWADILKEYLDFYNARDGNYPTPPVSDNEEDEVQNPLYQEGAGKKAKAKKAKAKKAKAKKAKN